MSKLTRVLSIICACLLVAICAVIVANLVAASAPLLDIAIGIADVLVSIAILLVVIKLCQRFRTPKVQRYYEPEPEPDYYEEDDYYEPEPEIVSCSEEIIIQSVGDYTIIKRKVQINY